MPFAVNSYDGGIPYQQILDYDGRTDSQPVYIGWADPGKLTSSRVWRIFKIAYDGSDRPTSIKFAGASPDFNKTWDSRTVYVYS